MRRYFELNSVTVLLLVAVFFTLSTLVLQHCGVHVPPAFGLAAFAIGGVAMELIGGQVTNPGGTVTALTALTGDNFQIRNANPGKRVWLLGYWAGAQTAGILEIKSPKLHDNVRPIRERIFTTDVIPYMPIGLIQQLYPQDVLTVSLSGGGAGKIEQASLLIWYEDLPGAAGRYIDIPTLNKRIVNQFNVEVAITAGVAGNYSGAAAINANFDTFIANTDYALIGYRTDAGVRSVCFRGADTANMRVGGPGSTTLKHLTGEWFRRLSERFGLPLIPIFNSANKAGITVDVVASDAGGSPNITAVFAQLSPGQ